MKLNPQKIEFWILVFFLVRLVGITNPPLEVGHSWRQVTGLMVARNFLEADPNILYPRIDETLGLEGIIGMEFPLLNYLHFLFSKLFDYSHWYGRLINLIVSSIGVFYFSRIIAYFFSKKIAFSSSIFLLSSIWFMFSRKMMPDTFCISLMIAGLFFGIKFLATGKFHTILLYILLSSLAILSKIPAGIFFATLLPIMFVGFPKKNKIILVLTTLIPLVLTYLWYFWWNPYLSAKYGIWYNAGKNISTGLQELIDHPVYTLKNFYFNAFHSYIVFGLFVVGLFFAVKNKEKKILFTFASVGFVFFIYMMKSGFFFYHHSYYIIPFVPVMALVAGYSLTLIKKRWIVTALILIATGEAILNQQHDFFIKDSVKYNLSLESVANKTCEKDDLIVINGGGNPLQLYLTHRKGWTCENEKLSNNSYLKSIKNKGCKYVFVDKHKNIDLAARSLFSDENFIVFTIEDLINKN